MLAELIATTDFLPVLREALPVIVGLIVIEGLLSVDNALAIAAMASHLEEKQRKVAMNIGYLGAYGFRILALIFAAQIVAVEWAMFLGALYLIWLMCAHFAGQKDAAADEGDAMNVHKRTFASTITMIALMDLSLSVDNVVAAVGLSRDKMLYVYIGVTIGIITLRIVAGYAVKWIERFPILEHTAFLLVGYVGLLLLGELWWHVHFPKEVKFIGIVLIIGASLLYSQKPALQSATMPLLRVCLLPMELFATVVGALIVLITWPFRKVAALVKS